MQNQETKPDNNVKDCFDVDVNILSSLTFNKHKVKMQALSGDRILFEQIRTVAKKYIHFCEKINVDCLKDVNCLKCILSLSRYASSLDRTIELCNGLESSSAALDKDSMQSMQFLEELSEDFTSSDWRNLFGCLELAVDVNEKQIFENKIFTSLWSAFEESNVPVSSNSIFNVIMFWLHMNPMKTPATKMCENYLSQVCQAEMSQAPHDLDIKVMRCLTSFHDNHLDTLQMQEALQLALKNLCVKESFMNVVKTVLDEKICEKPSQHITKASSRPRLSKIVSQLTKTHSSTNATTFENWSCLCKFGTNTSLRMQHLLYFMRVQVAKIAPEIYSLFFNPKIIDAVLNSHVEVIDSEPIVMCLRTLRTYHYKIDSLLEFRTECLSALPISTRQNLKQNQVLQLYIASYQHDSIREDCWWALLQTKITYNLRNNIQAFCNKHPFQVEAVVRALHEATHAFCGTSTTEQA